MSRPVERYSRILDEILQGLDLTHDFGRKRGYETAIDYARDHLIDDPHCNEFLKAAAKRLGFAPITFDALENRVKLPKGAWLDVWISDEDDEVALTGTRDGLQYMVDLLTQLKNSTDLEQHIHLDRGYLPMTENSASLVLFKEDESWFTGASGESASDYPQRTIDAKSVFAIQFIQYPPDDLPITANKLYRVVEVNDVRGDSTSIKEFPEGSDDRYRKFTFVADSGERFSYVFHLDDPGVNLFTHREIVALTMRTV